MTRFPSKAHFASWDGTAPIGASSGEQVRHRLSRAGNRQINRVLHIMAVVQLRQRDSEGRAYYDRKVAAGKTPREAMRSLKRAATGIVCHQMVLDARAKAAGLGGHMGAATGSSAADSHPSAGTSEKSLPGPATPTLRQPAPPFASSSAAPVHAAPQPRPRRQLDDGEDRHTLAKAGTTTLLTQRGARIGCTGVVAARPAPGGGAGQRGANARYLRSTSQAGDGQ